MSFTFNRNNEIEEHEFEKLKFVFAESTKNAAMVRAIQFFSKGYYDKDKAERARLRKENESLRGAFEELANAVNMRFRIDKDIVEIIEKVKTDK